MKTPLSVYALFHSENVEGARIYSELYKLLCRDINNPFSNGLDIPVYCSTGDDKAEIVLANSSSVRRVILLFIDLHMFCAKNWRYKIDELMRMGDDKTLMVGVKLYRHALSINKHVNEIQSIIVDKDENDYVSLFEGEHWQIFTTKLLDLLIRYVNGNTDHKAISVFISHSKQGNGNFGEREGEVTAKAVREFIYADTKLNSFFDVHDILDGYKFGEQIKRNIGNSSLLILFTDSYSSREWCRIETLSAKECQVPIVAVSLINNNVDRIFPYIGNIPSIVYDGNWRKVINLLLKTTLDQTIEKALLSSEVNETTEFLPYPPEAFNMSLLKPNTKKVLYPEPPLGNEELNVLNRIAQQMQRTISFCTPMSHLTENINLNEKKIGISIADSHDIAKYGIGEEMLQDLTVELTRHILKANGRLIYGGDLRQKGFTELFREIARQYGQKEKTEADVQYIKNYLHWPIYNDLTKEQRAEYLVSRIELVDAKPGNAVTNVERELYIPKSSNDNKLKWATSLTQMRKDSIEESAARIVAGGKTFGFSGFMAGIAEEFMISYMLGKPIYLIGGLGGCAHIIANIFEGKADSQCLLKEARQDSNYNDFFDWSITKGHKIDYGYFDGINIEHLNNGLNKAENLRLFKSVDIIEIVSLILKGLRNLQG